MKPRVYVETSVVSYLTARPSRDVVIAARQVTTREWWEAAPRRFELVISELVREEASAGDADAAHARLAAIASLPLLRTPTSVTKLAQRLVSAGALPERAAQDAMHVATAAVHRAPFLVTWNLRHIANAVLRPQIEAVCRQSGNEPPTLCTPDQLVMEVR